MLTGSQKKRLLRIARNFIENQIKYKKRLSLDVDDEQLKEKNGAFVTLKINDELKGCIGHIAADAPLYKTVGEMALQAAFGDPRFPSLKEDELEEVEIEISVLSPLEKISDSSKIEVGNHGIFMKKGLSSGLLLPQVATEYGWDRETFLKHTCYKAGLSEDAWKDKDTEIYIFSAEVFSEGDFKDEWVLLSA